MFRKLAATVAVSTALISPSAWSLGLGDIDADSGLNQPLKAEISLLSSRNVSEDDLRAKLASYESYAKFGVQREAYHNSLAFKVITKEDGTKAIMVESRESIKEPFINFLVELNWTQGKLLREYTLLLDPPVFAKTTPTAQPKAAQNTRRQPVVTERSEPTQSRQESRQENRTQESTSASTSPQPAQPKVDQQTRQLASSAEFNGDNWNVKRGQTLWSIAKAVRPEGVSVQQTLMAIFHNNPEAFINNDINRMKAGADLKVPEGSAISDVSQSAAIDRIRSSSNREEAPLDVRKTIEETDVEDTESQGGRLSIASVDEGSTEESGGSTLDADTDSSTSDGSSDDSMASDSGDASSDFDSELSASDGAADDGLTVEDETLSVLSGAADKTDETSADEQATDVADSYVDDNTQQDSSDTDATDIAASETDDKESSTAETEKPKPTNSMQQNSDKPFYQADDFWLWTGGGLVLLLLIGGGIVYRRNTAVEDDGGLLGMMGAASSSEPKPSKKRESFISDKDLKAPKENIDPVSQADILVARGRLSEAEDVLEGGLAAEPANQEIRVKLMEVVASQQDVEKFNRLKAELPNDFDHDSSLGLKVASLSSLVEPSEPEINVDSPEFNLPSEDDIFGDDSSEAGEVDLSDELASADTDSIDTVGNMGDNDSSDDSLDLDLGDFESQTKPEERSTPEAPPQVEENSIEFDLNQDDEDLVTQEDDTSTSETDSSDSDDSEGLNEEDAATKIDLAKAYMELGDDDAARDILQEIKDEGNRAQREQADKLLSQM